MKSILPKLTTSIDGLKSNFFIKQSPPKLGILIQNTISKFSKTKYQTQKRPPKFPKYHYQWTKKPQIKKFHKTDPPESGNSDSKYNFEIFKHPKTYIMRPQIKNLYKTDPPKTIC